MNRCSKVSWAKLLSTIFQLGLSLALSWGWLSTFFRHYSELLRLLYWGAEILLVCRSLERRQIVECYHCLGWLIACQCDHWWLKNGQGLLHDGRVLFENLKELDLLEIELDCSFVHTMLRTGWSPINHLWLLLYDVNTHTDLILKTDFWALLVRYCDLR